MISDITSYPKGKLRLLLSTALLAGTMAATPAFAQNADPQAIPTGETVVSGEATFDRATPGELNIDQTSDRAVINWDSFDIGEQATTTFNQPDTKSLAVNRVIGEGEDPTQILGTLNANGNIMVLDRNGVIFGENSVIDVGGIIASTGDVADADVTDLEQLTISNIGEGTIENRGTITVADAGLAALVAPTVLNSGTINAQTGKVSLGAGNTTTVDFFGDDLIAFAVADDQLPTQIENTGRINAQRVAFTTAAAADVVDNVINTGGLVNATSATFDGVKIVLTGAATDEGTGINTGGTDLNITRSEDGRTITLADANAVPPQVPGTGNGGTGAGPGSGADDGLGDGADFGTPPEDETAPFDPGAGPPASLVDGNGNNPIDTNETAPDTAGGVDDTANATEGGTGPITGTTAAQ